MRDLGGKPAFSLSRSRTLSSRLVSCRQRRHGRRRPRALIPGSRRQSRPVRSTDRIPVRWRRRERIRSACRVDLKCWCTVPPGHDLPGGQVARSSNTGTTDHGARAGTHSCPRPDLIHDASRDRQRLMLVALLPFVTPLGEVRGCLVGHSAGSPQLAFVPAGSFLAMRSGR
jgi:hypothetical protein